VDDHALREPRAGTADVPIRPESAKPAAERRLDLHRPTWRLVLVLAVPALVQQMLVLAVSVSDRWLAGHAHDPDPAEQIALQAAQTTANYLAWFISSYTVLISVGSTALVAHCIGAGDRRAATHATNQSLLLGTVLGLAGSLVALLCLPALVGLLQLEGSVARFAIAYLQPLFALLVFQVIEAAGIGCLVGAGDTVTGLWVRVGVAVFNVPLAWGFFHGLGPSAPHGLCRHRAGHGRQQRTGRYRGFGRAAPRPGRTAPALAHALARSAALASALARQCAGWGR
jgi:Na+-driven multidrug efflux pump